VLDATVEMFRKQLRRILELLRKCEEAAYLPYMQAAASGSDQELEAYLVSNELWGGSGSIADQAGIQSNGGRDRRAIEKRLIELGDMQLQADLINPRTQLWVEAFREAHRRGI
jgi:hypothetical protein